MIDPGPEGDPVSYGRENWFRRQVPLGGWRKPWVGWLLIAIVLFASGAVVERMAIGGGHHFLAYLGATVFGMLVGATELVARYRDKPVAPLETVPGLVYIAVNGAASLMLLWFLRTGQISWGTGGVLGPTLSQVLLAGFGSMALFRTSIFTLRVKETNVAIGPAAVLQVILAAADRACDRLMAGPRARDVKEIMRGVSFAQAKTTLVLHCLALMQNVAADERSQLTQAVSELVTATMSDEVKAYNLGLLLMNYVGEDVLRDAVDALGTLIQGPAVDDPPIFAQAGSLAFADMPALISICIALDPLTREHDAAGIRDSWLKMEPQLEREPDRNVVVLARLRRYFGPETLSRAITLLTAGKTPVRRVDKPLTLEDLQPSSAAARKADQPPAGPAPPGGTGSRP
jgi:hypothetical protein